MEQLKNNIMDFLNDCQKEAGKSRIECREFELLSLFRRSNLIFPALKQLCREGKITRSSGYCWKK